MPDRQVTLDAATYEGMTAELATLRQRLEEAECTKAAMAHRCHLFQAILDNIPHRVWMKDQDGTYLIVNQSYCQAVGLPADAVIGKTDPEVWSAGIAQAIQADDAALLHSQQPSMQEWNLNLGDGSEHWYVATKAVLTDDTGAVVGTTGIAIDITAQKRTELELRRCEERFQSFMDHSPVPAWIVDGNGRMLYVSAAYLQLFHLSGSAVVGKTLHELYEPEIAQQFHDNNRRVIAGGTIVETLEVTPRPDGSLGDFQVFKFPIPVPDGEAIVGGIALDVTDRRQAEAALQRLNADLEARVEERTNALVQTEQRLRRHNAAFQELVHRGTLEQPDLQRALQDITEVMCHGVEVERASIWFYASDRDMLRCDDLYIRDGGTHSHGMELVATYYPAYFQALQARHPVVVHDAYNDSRTQEFKTDYLEPLGIASMLDVPIWFRGQMMGVICLEHVGRCRRWALEEENFVTSIADIVRLVLEGQERQRAESVLQSQAQLLDQVKGSIVCTNLDGIITSWNQGSEAVFGYTAEAVIGQHIGVLYPLEQHEFLLNHVIAPVQQQGQRDVEVKVRHRSGEVVDIFLSLSLQRDRQGNPTGMIGYAVDISDRKRAEAQLLEQEQFLRSIYDGVSSHIFVVDVLPDDTFRFAGWNRAVENLYGIPAAASLGKTPSEMFGEETGQELCQRYRTCAQSGQVTTYEDNYIIADKEDWWSITLNPLRNDTGCIYRIIGTALNITDRKQAELGLQEREAQYRTVFEAVTDGIEIYDLETAQLVAANPATAAMHGCTLEEFKAMPPEEFIHPDYLHLFGELLTAIRAGQPFQCHSVNFRPGRVPFHVEVRATRMIYNRKPHILAIVRDVDDRKRAEAQLRQQEAFLRSIYDGIDAAIFVANITEDGEFRYVGMNAAMVTSRKYQSRDDWQNKTPIELLGEEIGTEVLENYRRCLEAGTTISYEVSVVNAMGEQVWSYTTLTPLQDQQGRFYQLVGTAIDISDRKQAEAALQEREAFLRSIYDGSETQIFVYNVSESGELRHAGWNAYSERITGRKSRDCEGKTFEELFGADGAAIQRRFQSCYDQGAIISYEECITFQNQQSWWFTTLNPLKTEDGRVYRIVGTALDITKLKQAEVALQDALAEALGLNAILDNLVDGLLVTNTEGRVSRYNPALLEMYTLGTVDLQGEDVIDLPMPGLADLLAQTYANPGEVFTGEVELNRDRIGQAAATTIYKRSAAGEAEIWLGSAVLIRDVTAEREIDRMKTDFISTVSHELRTPLTSVLGFASIIKEKLEEDVFPQIQTADRKLQRALKKVDANVSIIVSEAERLTALINDVLDIAKMEAGKVEWQMQPLNPEEVIDQAIAATSSLFETSSLAFHRNVPRNLPQILGDRDRLIQVIINLISNAVKFTEEGSVTVRARVESSEVLRVQSGQVKDNGSDSHPNPSALPHTLIISIVDTGMGIAPEDQPKVFEKFKQVGDTLTDKPKGTGLGLPICQQIVDYHGGVIWVESELGVGSTFSFSLPLNQLSDSFHNTATYHSLVRQLKEHVATTATAMPSHRKTILVVDDDAHIRELLRQELESEGYIVQQATNGMDAISQVKIIHPDLIILDVMMPQINGFDVAAILKNDPRSMGIPIIILSIIEDKERGFRIGIDRYLTKPINTPQLLGDIQSLLTQVTSDKKVLVVDQNASTAQTLSEVLRAQGYQVVEANGSDDCIEKAISHQPDMIIVDSMLSQEHNLVKTLRFEKGLENVFFVLLGDSQSP